MSNKTHTISTDDFEDYAPTIRLAGCHGAGSSKTLDVQVSFTRDIHSGRDVAKAIFLVSDNMSNKEDLATEFLADAIADYNDRP